jgi:hypothetical protein
MTWKLLHDRETIGEWSDDLIDKVVKELMNRKKSSESEFSQKESTTMIAEFLPDPIREVLLGLP